MRQEMNPWSLLLPLSLSLSLHYQESTMTHHRPMHFCKSLLSSVKKCIPVPIRKHVLPHFFSSDGRAWLNLASMCSYYYYTRFSALLRIWVIPPITFALLGTTLSGLQMNSYLITGGTKLTGPHFNLAKNLATSKVL